MGQAVPDDDLPSGNAVPTEDLPETGSPVPATWLNAAKGVGEAALAVGAGGLRAVTSAANDILPGATGRAAIAKEIATDPILNYSGGPEAKPILDTLSNVTRPIAKIGSAIHQGISDIASPRVADIAGDIGTLLPGVRGAPSMMGDAWNYLKEKGATLENHPLAEAAQTQMQGLAAMKDRAESLGFDLPEGGTQARHAQAAITNRPLVQSVVRNDLQLPKRAPLTPDMIDQGMSQYATPAYDAIRKDPKPVVLDKQYADSMVDLMKNSRGQFNPSLLPPAGGQISGADAVAFSQDARFEARHLATATGDPAAIRQASLYRQAAENLEDAVQRHYESVGQPEVAKNWDAARVYAAKAHAYQDALDGAGNVNVANLKTQLFKKGKPFTGDQEMLANLGAQYPEAFKTTRVTMPMAGPIRRGAAYLAPVVGAGVGGFIGGTPGGAIGAAAGEHAAGKILGQ